MPQASEQIFEAAYVWGSEVNTLRVCGSNSVYWTDATTWVLEPVVEYYKTHTTEPYTEIHVRFRGHFHDEEVDGVAKQYDGLLHVSEVLEMKAVVPENCRNNK